MADARPPSIDFRAVQPRDEAVLSEIFQRRSDYFEAATGSPPGPADVQSLFYALPEGATDNQKRVISVLAAPPR